MTFFFLAEPVGATSQQQHGAHLVVALAGVALGIVLVNRKPAQ